jgi:hypothetical protein
VLGQSPAKGILVIERSESAARTDVVGDCATDEVFEVAICESSEEFARELSKTIWRCQFAECEANVLIGCPE